MKKRHGIIICSVIVFVLVVISVLMYNKVQAERKITYNAQNLATEENGLIRMLGRYSIEDDRLFFDYTLSGLEFSFTGTKCVVSFCSDFLSSEDRHAVVGVFINDAKEESARLVIDKETCKYTIFSSLKEENVVIKLVKFSEAKQGTVGIEKIEIYGDEPQLAATAEKEHLFWFIGDSITCGMGNETTADEEFTTLKENGNLSYGAITARNLGADVEFVSYSGIGLIWGTSDDMPPMTEMYRYSGYTRGKREPQLWEVKKEPDVICVNLGTNDTKFMESEADKEQFVSTYVDFLKELRSAHEDALLVVCYGTMQLEHKDVVEESFALYKAQTMDENCECLIFDEGLRVGSGCGGHPTVETHKNMAEALTELLEKNYDKSSNSRRIWIEKFR